MTTSHSTKSRDALTFIGFVKSGKGQHRELIIPGRSALPAAPQDWPERLEPGSLNIRIDDRAYPKELLTRCPGEFVQKLDSGHFRPAFEIPFAAIENNKLRPKETDPRRGDAQVWRAAIWSHTKQLGLDCWVLRRFGSSIKKQLEIVSNKHVRTELRLADGEYVVVEMYGLWKPAQNEVAV